MPSYVLIPASPSCQKLQLGPFPRKSIQCTISGVNAKGGLVLIYKGSLASLRACVLILPVTLFFSACGGGYGGGGNGGGGGGNPPAAPTGLTATAGNAQIALSWTASSGASTYNVYRGTTVGGESATPLTTGVSATSYTDTGLTGGTKYYYVVAAVNTYGTSAKSSEVAATPAAPTTAVNVTIDALTNRHSISPYIYGGAYPKDAPTVTDSGLSVVRWGGNATSQYNWVTQTSNSAADWYFSDYTYTEIGDSDSVKFIQDAKAAGTNPLMTMVMLDWVSRGDAANNTANGQLYSFSVAKYGTQCKVRPDNSDAGNGQKLDCSTNISGNDPNDAHVPILDDHSSACPGTALGPCVYRNDWAAALASAFGSAPHFYDMDNETDIWGGTHHDVHPNASGYNELRDTYLRVSRGLKTWDPAAIRLGPVSCCWWFYWNVGPTNASGVWVDKAAHAGIDFLPWWLNEVYWQDQIANNRSLDIFDIHAYPDGPDTTNFTQAQKQAAAVSIYRDYWDPVLPSPSGLSAPWATSMQPNNNIAFRIPRMRAMVNSTYPGTPLAFTEWSAAFAGESDFSTVLGDADAYGILGRERVGLASRWLAPDPANPNYQALKLYTNYDGAHSGFNQISVSATHNADPSLFSVYAATKSSGNLMTVIVLNKDPNNAAQTSFTFNGFTPSQVTTYTLSQSSPKAIVAGSAQAWPSSITFQPYTATLLDISGSSTPPASEWDLNPDTIMVAAGGTVALSPKLTSGSTGITLNNPVFDSFEGSTPCSGASGTATSPNVTAGSPGAITLNAPASAGFCHFSVTASDGTTQGGWLVVGNPAATLSKTTDPGSGTHGTAITLAVTLAPGRSGGTAAGASVFFTVASGSGSLQNVPVGSEQVFTGTKVIAVTNSSGVATVTFTLPPSTGPVNVTAEGPFGLGHPSVTFTEMSN